MRCLVQWANSASSMRKAKDINSLVSFCAIGNAMNPMRRAPVEGLLCGGSRDSEVCSIYDLV